MKQIYHYTGEETQREKGIHYQKLLGVCEQMSMYFFKISILKIQIFERKLKTLILLFVQV